MKNIFIAILSATLLFSCASGKKNKSENTEQSALKTEKLKVLFVLTSNDELGTTGEKTGFWVEEFATPYYALLDKGVEITLATPKGGKAPIDPRSADPSSSTPATERYNKDKETQGKIENTLVLATVNANDYDAVFYPGGHGPLWDLSEDSYSVDLIQNFNQQGKPIAFVCHAPAALKNVKDTNGEFLVKGKKVTGFSNTEEAAVKLTDVVPFLVESMLSENGGIYSKADAWKAYAVEDGNLITGQNPASSALVAEKLMKMLNN